MSVQSRVKTHTQVDIRRVAECFAADLSMLARRTRTRSDEWAQKMSHDVTVAALYGCLSAVDVQLSNNYQLVAAHKYTVLGRDINDSGERPGGNDWIDNPNNVLDVILSIKDEDGWQKLKNSGILKCGWGPSDHDLRYLGMREVAPRQYSSNGYGWSRQSFKMAG